MKPAPTNKSGIPFGKDHKLLRSLSLEFTPQFPSDESPAGVYVHIPFCRTKCNYCAFVSRVHDSEKEKIYLEALIKEIRLWKTLDPIGSAHLDTLYFGGGTPSLIHTDRLIAVMEECRASLGLAQYAEITIEINPGSIGLNSLRDLRLAGVNRASLGIQSVDDEDLRLMDRNHNARDALLAVEQIRDAGFSNVSVDLIAGFPWQDLASIHRNLRRVLQLGPEHLSVYLLEVKEGTVLSEQIRLGKLPPVNDDLIADMYEEICRSAVEAGYTQYEISNFAREGYACRHNLKYWTDAPYIGLGVAAHGMTGRARYANVEDLQEYVGAVLEDGLPRSYVQALTPETRFREALIMGMRLTDGVDLAILGRRYQVNAAAFVMETAGDLFDAGLLELLDGRIMLTSRGRLLSNTVFARWV